MKRFVVLLLLIIPAFSYSQTVEQLFKASVKDSTVVLKLIEAAYAYEQEKPDSALLIYAKAIAISQQIKYPKGEARGYLYSGIVNSDQANYAEAIKVYQKAIEIYQAMNDKTGEAKGFINMANIFFYKGSHKQSLKYYLDALLLLESLPNSAALSALYTNLGSVYSSIREYDKSIQYHRRSYRSALALGDSLWMCRADLNLGVTYKIIDKPDSAEYYFKQALVMAGTLGSVDDEYLSINNLASLAEHNKDYEESLRLARAAQQKALETEDPNKISSAEIMLGISYLNLDQYKSALEHLNTGVMISKELGLLENLAVGYISIGEINEKQGNFKTALENFKLANIYSDSLQNAANYQEMGKLQGKYDLESELREKQIATEKAEAEATAARERRDRIQYFLIAMVVLVIFVVLKLIRNFNISVKTSQLITLVALLLFFEFLLIVFDPYIESLADNVPVYKLALNLILALLIFPIHEWLLKVLSNKSRSDVLPEA